MNILLTGGAGYIGSHTCVIHLDNGHDVVVVSNLGNSKVESLILVEDRSGKEVLTIENLSKSIQDKKLYDNVNFKVFIKDKYLCLTLKL